LIIDSKIEEMAVLKAKLTLDMLEYHVNVVAEYPDLVDENNQLYDQIDEIKKALKIVESN
jgi:hypothetical protein